MINPLPRCLPGPGPSAVGGIQHFARGGEPVRRLRRAAWLSLALLSLFTMAAGAAVAHMLPPRLALWRLPTVASRGLAQAGPVLGAVPDPRIRGAAHTGKAAQGGHGAAGTGVTRALSGLLGSPALGPHV